MANEFEREMTTPSIMAGHDGPARTIAANAASIARANILATREAAPATEPELAPARNTEPGTQDTGGWPITRPNIPGAEPGESPLMTVFRQARTEILLGGADEMVGGFGRWNGSDRAMEMTKTPEGAASFVAGQIQHRRTSWFNS